MRLSLLQKHIYIRTKETGGTTTKDLLTQNLGPEPVRLVIWDLDGTFWAGTLTEGGHTYSHVNHNIIIELAKRGIVSSICSKNDFETIKAILVERGIWDYFIFPSINWNPKGPRLKQLVENVQLRPETVLLLDDNPQNLREAEHFVPGIQTADACFIPQVLHSPLFKGREDPELSRLNQYKLFEIRKAHESVATDNIDFLRSCDIRVTIDHDVEKHIDRAVELINRTNQLNFTKRRLPEDAQRARDRLRKLLGRINIQAGIVHVQDRHGDYGYCGLYVQRSPKGESQLIHFCFSCRILGMGVEAWLYNRIGRPSLHVAGEVLTDVLTAQVPDWISAEAERLEKTTERRGHLPTMVIRGACAVSPLAHYFQMESAEVTGEFNTVRDSAHHVRIDHSLMLRYALEGVSSSQMEIFRSLGFEAEDFETAFGLFHQGPEVRVLSAWVDVQPIVYRHKRTGLLVPYKIKIGSDDLDPMTEPEHNTPAFAALPECLQNSLLFLREWFEAEGVLSTADARRNMDSISVAMPPESILFVLTIPEGGTRRKGGKRAPRLNGVVNDFAARDSRIVPLAITDFAEEDERIGQGHFHRRVYYRLYQEISARITARFGARARDH
jgi:FkbH-like protein